MCEQCNYKEILENAQLEASAHRLHVLEVIGSNNCPLTAAEIFRVVERSTEINKVTVYRILDLLVESKVVEKIRMGGRAACYGMAPNKYHAPHPHFFCTRCEKIDCLPADRLHIDMERLKKTFPGQINRVEVQVEGVCQNCLKKQ